MSGVFGVLDARRQTDVNLLAKKMTAAMSHREWYVADCFTDEALSVALGRLGIGIFNRPAQPIWNADHTVAMVMAGELYSGGELIAGPELTALSTFETCGADFARHLNGAFVIALWDARKRQLIVTNDRFALYPVYYAIQDHCLIFAPEVKGVLCAPAVRRSLDLTALAQYTRFQHLLETRTFFDDIRQLAPASVLSFDLAEGRAALQTYWSFADIPHRPTLAFGEAVREVGRLLRQAVRRSVSGAIRPGVYLSGGLDSRILLGMVERRPITSLTYGALNSRDVYYAGKIAQAAGSEHHWFDLPDGSWVTDHVGFHLELTEGFHSWIHAHGISTLGSARQLIDVNLSGWDGGTVMGHPTSIEPLQTHPVDEVALTIRLFELFNQAYTWPGITEAEERCLFQPDIWAQANGLAFDSFREALRPYFGLRPDIRGELFFIRNHCGRLTHNMITFCRSHVEVRFPFFDYELFDFLYSLPAGLRADRRLYRAVIQRETPALAYIPYDNDEFLPTAHGWVRAAHAAMVKLGRRMEWALRLSPRSTLYADYEAYLRHELRPWAEAILFDRRTAERGLFAPAFLRTLMARHMSGLELWTIGKIAPIITYEMMLRRLFDDLPAAGKPGSD